MSDCNCKSYNDLEAKLATLAERVEVLQGILEARLDGHDEDVTNLTERVRDLENLADNGYSVEDYGS